MDKTNIKKTRVKSEEIDNQIQKIQKSVIEILSKRPYSPTEIQKELKKKGGITVNWLLCRSKFRERILECLERSGQVFKLNYSKLNKKLLEKIFHLPWGNGDDEAPYKCYYILGKYAKKDPLLLEIYETRKVGNIIRGFKSKEKIKHLIFS